MEFDYKLESQRDLTQLFRPFFKKRIMKLTEDGLYQVQTGNPPQSPWYFVRPDLDRNCFLLHDILFPTFKWVPSRCQECWKVVVRPQTVEDLFKLVTLQEKSPYFCKCGTEPRQSVCGNYGGYFYFNSIQDGLDGLDYVRDQVGKELSPETPVILKRGCTEYEHVIPDSHKWTIPEGQKEIEDYVLSKLVMAVKTTNQTLDQVRHVMRAWVEYAYGIGDLTYKSFTHGDPLYPPYITYERDQTHGIT